MNDFQKEAAVIALKKLFSRSFFSITDFDSLAKLVGSTPSYETRKTFRAIHCVDYSEMSTGFRQELYRKVIEALSIQDLPEIRITETGIEVVEPKQSSTFSRLLGRGS